MGGQDPRLGVAISRHRAGAVDEAVALYQAILTDNPAEADALHLLGVARQQQGDYATSVTLISQALALRQDAAFASNLANAYLALGRHNEAAEACRLALSLNAVFGMAYANLGVALNALGQREEAAEALRMAVAIEPSRPEAQASLGAVLVELGRADEAVAVLNKLISNHPDYPQAHYNLGNALAVAETPEALEAALACYDRAITLAPAYAEAHANRGGVLRRQGALEAAMAAYETALRLNPQSALTHYNHGLLLGELGRSAESLAAHDRAIALAPTLAVAHSHRGNVLTALERDEEALAAHSVALSLTPDDPHLHYNLGLTLTHQARYSEAITAHSRALALKPDYAEAHAALGGNLVELGQVDAALFAARRAIALKPDLGLAHAALGQALLEVGDLDGAEAALTQAIAFRPTLAQSHLNLGVLRFRQGRLADGEAAYEQALALRPDTWEARYNRGVARLQRGDYVQGWADFELRLRAPERRRADAIYPQPLWTDQPLQGRSILLHAEQGLGDTIQCLRFVPQIAALGAEVTVEASASLRRLVEGMPGVAHFTASGAAVPLTDFHLPLFSLPHRLAVTLDRLPGPIPYFQVDPALSASWARALEALAPHPTPRVGLVWSGNVTAKVDRGRSLPLAAFEPLAQAVGAPLISLQKLFGLDQLANLPAGMAVTTLGADYDAGDLADTAAVIQALDLVVACDTAVAHLAGALGKPVWMAINRIGDWRWLTERSDSPWYPALRLYRQPQVGDWASVIAAMAADWRDRG